MLSIYYILLKKQLATPRTSHESSNRAKAEEFLNLHRLKFETLNQLQTSEKIQVSKPSLTKI